MHVVALTELVGSLEVEADAIAAGLGLSALELRVSLAHPLPRVLSRSAARGEANQQVAWLRARGHGALACDTSEVVAAAEMVKVRRFSFDDTFFWAHDADERLAWADVAAILLVATRTEVARTNSAMELVVMGGRSAFGVNVARTAHENVAQDAVYLFPRDAARPWLLTARDAQYLALGSRMHRTRKENFSETLALVRTRSTEALFDDRFFKHPIAAAQAHHVRGLDDVAPSPSDAGVDLVVHLLARWLLRDRSGPYRGSGDR